MTVAGTALRSGGELVTIRSATREDLAALHTLDAEASDRSLYFRFFSGGRIAAEKYTDALGRVPQSEQRDCVVAVVDDGIVGMAVLEQLDDDTGEIAVLIADAVHHEGLGTLLVEELIIAAHARRLSRLTADVLADNTAMLVVLRDLGLPAEQHYADGVVSMALDLEADSDLAERVTARERMSEAASLRSALAPASIALVGVGSRDNSVGRAVLNNLRTGGYCGDIAVVHPRHSSILGIRTSRSISELGRAPDLAVVAVPATQVLGVAEELGRRGAKSLLVVSSGFGELGGSGRVAQAELVRCARAHGMRLVGPNCLGIVNTDPSVRLNATFATMPMNPGGFALASQSGAVGIAVAHASADRGLGLAQLVSMGNKADVSGNDLLLAWDADDRVQVIGLYLESIGNARKFSRIARSVSRTKPILALKAGRTSAAQLAGQSHTAAAAAAEPVVDALFAAAGVQRVDTMEALLDAAAVLCLQPLPGGTRVVIVGNSGGPEILATDTAESAGLQVPELSEDVQAALRAAVPSAASLRNPVDLGAAVQPDQIETVLTELTRCGEIDAVVTVFAETLAARPTAVRDAVLKAASDSRVPVVATEVGTAPSTAAIPGGTRRLPVFGFPESSVRALSIAVGAARAMTLSALPPLRPVDVSLAGVRSTISTRVERPGWLDPATAGQLLSSCGVAVARQQVVRGAAQALDATRKIGYPVVLKRAAGVHKSDTGGVFADIRSDADVTRAMDALGDADVLVQRYYSGGTELIVGAVQDKQFGPVVMAGPGGVLTDLADHTVRLAPVTDHDVSSMLSTPSMRRLLAGVRGRPPVSDSALRDLIVRVSWLVEHFPEVAELDLNPVICRGDELVAVDVKIRLAPAEAVTDPLSRLLSGGAMSRPAQRRQEGRLP